MSSAQSPTPNSAPRPPQQDVATVARRSLAAEEPGILDSWRIIGEPWSEDSGQFPGVVSLPQASEDWLGFHLVQELGRGAFGRVFLARQPGLANRPVALKVSTDLFEESQTLAQLQHSHIVPIYSVHQSGPLQAVCMPYFGATTLVDVLKDLGASPSLPESGKALVGTVHQRKSVTRRIGDSTQPRSSVPCSPPSTPPATAPVATPPEEALRKLEKLSYVDAVLWIAARLAEGLAHAHDRGVIHRDLKPANVLLTDDGQPMLLDFNLSENTQFHGAAAGRVGGTLPYMAPEHLEAYQGRATTVDRRSDLYSLGVVLYELLTARHPFSRLSGSSSEMLSQMIAERRTLPEVRRWNKKVSPAVESIIRHCLEPDPARRYQSAHELLEDLERQRQNLPLRHAPEPSLRERARKWMRRHPRLTLAVATSTAVAIVLLPVAAFSSAQQQKLHREAHGIREQFLAQKETAHRLLNRRYPDRAELRKGIHTSEDALKLYRVLEDEAWRDRPAVRHLPQAEQSRLEEEVGELLLLLSRAAAIEAGDDPQAREKHLRIALEYNSRAEAVRGTESFSKAGWVQRAELTRRLKGRETAKPFEEKARTVPLRTAQDHFLLAGELMAERRFNDALPLLQEATDRDPRHYWSWYCQGICHFELRQDIEAIQCYRAALALWPDSYELHFNRALVYQRLGRRDRAAADFDEAIRLRPTDAEVHLNRALLRGEMGKHAEAIEDLNLAVELGYSRTRVLLLRAVAREKVGHAAGARADRAEGLRLEPTDAVGWTTRGWARMETDPQSALSDFDEALKLNPRYL
jgi:serine/threonine protein kinase/Tfp pilus assembly protein PilF